MPPHIDAEVHPDVIEPRPVIAFDIEEHKVADIDPVQVRHLRPVIWNQDDPGRSLVELE